MDMDQRKFPESELDEIIDAEMDERKLSVSNLVEINENLYLPNKTEKEKKDFIKIIHARADRYYDSSKGPFKIYFHKCLINEAKKYGGYYRGIPPAEDSFSNRKDIYG